MLEYAHLISIQSYSATRKCAAAKLLECGGPEFMQRVLAGLPRPGECRPCSLHVVAASNMVTSDTRVSNIDVSHMLLRCRRDSFDRRCASRIGRSLKIVGYG
jgi:hypothetical protein